MRYFKLTRNRLIYFDDQDDRVTLLKRNLPITNDTSAEIIRGGNADESETYPWQFRVRGDDGVAELAAPTEMDRNEWIQDVNRVAKNKPKYDKRTALLEMKKYDALSLRPRRRSTATRQPSRSPRRAPSSE